MPDVSHLEHPFLYRAIKSRRWMSQKSAAFRLRLNETGLSVILLANCTKDVCNALQNTCYGEFVLETLAVISTRRRIEQDAPNHAQVLGLPLYEADELAKEEAASDLADLVTSVQSRPS